MRLVHAILLFGAITAGCGGMMTGSDGMRGAVGDAISEDQQHLTASRTISLMPGMLDEVDRHTSRATAIIDDMGVNMNAMQHCSGIQSMMDLRDGMQSELAAHASTMHAETDLTEARAEVTHHVGTMTSMLDDMGSMLDRMHCSGW